MLVAVDGKTTDVMLSPLSSAFDGMAVIPSSNTTWHVHPENACKPMLVTPDGILILASPLQL